MTPDEIWPVQPLVDALRLPADRWAAALADAAGVSSKTCHRWAHEGLSTGVADRVACKVGLHPALVWDGWNDQPTPDDVPPVTRLQVVPPPTRRPPRRHGTNAMWVKGGCRCDDCNRAHTRYEKRRLVARAAGRAAYVDATPAREHLEWLNSPAARRIASAAAGTTIDQPWWFTSAARELGLTRPQLAKILDGQIRRVRPRTLAAVLSLTTDTAWSGATVPRGVVEQDIAVLMDRGWTRGLIGQEMRRRCGEDPGWPYLQLSADRVRRRHATAIRELVDEQAAPPRLTGWELRRRASDGRWEATG